ncbi:MAG: CDP-glycerol glycerophosphotransferase family protein [Parcubacteria group bacterium]|nr:CDP-glycerol glycerophosphotransferase family protein [Parcubacteria group bacterium]
MFKKTIFITAFFNLAVRNILSTDFLDILKSRKDLRVILLVPEGRKFLFEREFGETNVVVEEIPFRRISRLNLLFHFLSWNLLSTHSKKIHRLVQLRKDNNYLMFWLTSLLGFLGRFNPTKKVFRWLDYNFSPRDVFDPWFDKYKPDLVLATDIQDLRVQELSDTALVRVARNKDVASVGMSRSWDAITTKGLLRTLPDILVTQSENMKKMAVCYHGLDPERVAAVGFPHYDSYVKGTRIDRGVFFKRLELNPNKRLIFFVPPSDLWTGDKSLNFYLLRLLAGLGEQVVVRFPLFGELDIGDFVPPGYMIFDKPRNVSQLEESFLNRQDDAHLADLIYHSDVVLTGPSSIILDAAILDKPTILLGFDGDTSKPYWKSLRRYYDYEHQQVVINGAGTRIATSGEELIAYLRVCLNNPQQGSTFRRTIAQEACYSLDGQSGERLAKLVLKRLDL